MANATHRQTRWRGTIDPLLHEPEVTPKVVTRAPKEKLARISQRQLGPVVALLKRMAVGGDATTAVDAATLLPVVERAFSAAPPGQPRHRVSYRVQMPDGAVLQVQGLHGAAKASGKARSTIANALSVGRGTATFPTTDQHGNPATITVSKVVPL
jgi:hypothetical protein